MTHTPSSIARLSACASLVALLSLALNPAQAKSLYMIADINAAPSPIRTYDIQTAPNHLVLQAKQTIPSLAGGAVGLAIDTDAKKLFATYERSRVIQLVDATNFNVLGTTTAPGASNLAGIVVDQGKKKVYAVDRNTNHLYVYSWASDTNTLTLDGGAAINLPGVTLAHGLALDEANGHLYVGDANSASVSYFNTTSWKLEGTITPTGTTQKVMGLAVDTKRGILYMGNAYQLLGSLGQLVKVVLATGATTLYTLPGAQPAATGGDNIIGVAVDEDTGNVYATTGNQGVGGTDTLIVFDQNLQVLKNDLGDIGSPTGIAIPRASVSYNPLNFTKTADASSVISGQNLTYTLCYDNPNEITVTNVSITDTLPAGTSLVSATGPYSVVGSTLTWLVGNVNGGAAQTCYSMVVKVNAAAGTQLVNGATITGMISDSEVPTTQTVTTDVTADIIIDPKSVGTSETVKGQGGGGSAGLIELLAGGGLLAATALRRRRATAARQASLLALAVTAATSAQAGSLANVYMGGGLGQAKAETSSQDMADDLVSRGYADAQVSLHNTHTGGKLFVGYQLNPFVAFETAYVDLGRTTSSTTTTVDEAGKAKLAGDVSGVHPILIKGLGVSTVVRYPIGGFSVFSKLGLFNWTARAKAAFSPGGTPVTQSQFTGTDPSYGFGAAYDIPGTQLSLRGEWEHFATSRNDIKFVSMSLAYRF